MKQRYFLVLPGSSFPVSASIITRLANADMDDASYKRGKFIAKKQNLNSGSMIDKTEFNGRIVAMFGTMDSNSDGSLNDKEINKMGRHLHGKMINKPGGYAN